MQRGSGVLGGGAGWVICANCKDNRERVRAVIELAFVAGSGGKRQTKLEANFESLWPAAKCKSQTDRDSNSCGCGGGRRLQASVNFVAYFSARHAIKMQKSQRQQNCLPLAPLLGQFRCPLHSLFPQHPKNKDQNRCTPKLKRKYQAQTQSQTQTEA